MRILLFLLLSQLVSAQKFITRNGVTEFKASVNAFEPVEAINNSTTAILTSDGTVASQLFISAFKFKVALMQEHFNENYMESDQYPKATFKGEISNFNSEEIDSSKEYFLKGILKIRDISKEVKIPVSMNKVGEVINLKGSFIVAPNDFDIEIPTIVRKKIADKIKISINYDFSKKK